MIGFKVADGSPIHVEAAGGASAFDNGKNNVAEGAAAHVGDFWAKPSILPTRSFVYFATPPPPLLQSHHRRPWARERPSRMASRTRKKEEPRALEGYPKGVR